MVLSRLRRNRRAVGIGFVVFASLALAATASREAAGTPPVPGLRLLPDGGVDWDAMPLGARAKARALMEIADLDDAGAPIVDWDASMPHRFDRAGLAGENFAQARRLDAYLRGAKERAVGVVKKTSRELTDPQRALLQGHFRLARRLLRVQALAENARKPALAKRAADDLVDLEARVLAKLEAIGIDARADGGVP